MPELTERQMRRLVSTTMQADVALLLLDHDGLIEWANPAIGWMFGWEPDELVGRPFSSLLYQASQEDAELLRRRAQEGHPTEARQLLAVRRDGSMVALQASLSGSMVDDGQPTGASVRLRDVTEENQRIRELARLQDRLRASFFEASMPQAFVNLQGRFDDVNAAMGRLVGCPREELVGRDLMDFVDSVERSGPIIRSAIRRARSDRSVRFEIVGRHAEGHQLFLLIDMTVLTDQVGRPSVFTFFARDVSDVRDAKRRLESREAFYSAVNRRSWDLAIVTDAEAVLTYASASVQEVLGYESEEFVGRSGFDFIHEDDQAKTWAMLERVLREPGRSERVLLRLRHKAGHWLWFEDTATNCLDHLAINGLVGNLRDVTAEVKARHALERSEARYRAIVETAQEGIVALGPNGETLLANTKLADLLGCSVDELYECGLWSVLDPDDAKGLHDKFLGRAAKGPERYEVSFRGPTGLERNLSISASPLVTHEDGRVGSLAMVSDVTMERRSAEELRHQALHDALTGLPNRALFTDRLEVAAARQERDRGVSLAVLFLDLDHLKVVNDRGGHAAGDRLLIEIGERIQRALRASDTVARIGGDEFAVICEDTSTQGAVAVARRIQEALNQPFLVAGSPLRVSASIGIAASPPNPAEDLLRLADTAMYQAKTRSRGSYVVFDSSFAREEERRRELTGDLRDALATDRVFLHYQPVIDLTGGGLRGIEALVRWNHPTKGMLPALELIDAAQEAGLEAELDKRVLRAACTQMGRLVREGVMGPESYVSVNISARSASSERLDLLVPDILAAARLEPHQLMLEVTETSIMTDLEHTVQQLRSLSDLGVRVAVDDFGTGYSSLAYLHRLPLGILKIDRSFVSGLPDDPDSSTIVRSVINLAESLGLHTIAEGIERKEQADVLRELGCNSGQGFLWSRAVPPAALDEVSAALRPEG